MSGVEVTPTCYQENPMSAISFDPLLDFPHVRALEPLRRALFDLQYTEEGIELAVTFAHRYGSLECCPTIFEGHRDMLEELVPDAPEAEWACFSGRYELGPKS